MRNPVRSEADAFHIVVGSGAVLVAAVVVGALVSPWVGLALVAGAVAGALVWEIATRDPQRRQPLKEAMELGRATAPPPTGAAACSSSPTARCRARAARRDRRARPRAAPTSA